MTNQNISPSVLNHVHAQMLADPQLPCPDPTPSFWQLPPHRDLSEVQSAELPQTVEYAVIGSGVTGCSVSKNLLELSESGSVAVFEARSLCSGATGRNGGLLLSFVPGVFARLVKQIGLEQAVQIARFANRTLEKMHALGNESPELKAASEVRRVQHVTCFMDDATFQDAKNSIMLYKEHVPEDRESLRILTAEEAKEYNFRGVSGIVTQASGAFWPYRLVTAIWAQLRAEFPTRLAIETLTAVTSIANDAQTNEKYPYLLTTPRGTVRATHVIHAVNGYTGHLLPRLRGIIFPFRGTMSTQKPPLTSCNLGDQRAWSFIRKPNFDTDDALINVGLYYANQNPYSGDVFIGGEKACIGNMIVADDGVIDAASERNIIGIYSQLFPREGSAEVKQVWSGIMGFTGDHMPIVGKVPAEITGRGNGEWVAAGFNGYGMPQCWSCGEAVAKMLLGVDVSNFLPESFEGSSQRFSKIVARGLKLSLEEALGL